MAQSEVCSNQEYCTNCTIRKDCAIRRTFYSEEYFKWRKESYDLIISTASKLFLAHSSAIISGTLLTLQQMDKRRDKEMELYPEFSPE